MTSDEKKHPLQIDFLKDYFVNNPNRDIPHKEIVDFVIDKYYKETGERFRDPDRGIRNLYSNGFLLKIEKGIYRYDPNKVKVKEKEEFTATQKNKILKRDGYKCVFCERGKAEGMELHVDHIKPRDKGGKATLDNGQTLCSQCNIFKDNYGHTAFGKRMFIRLRKKATEAGDEKMLMFCNDILAVYQKHNI